MAHGKNNVFIVSQCSHRTAINMVSSAGGAQLCCTQSQEPRSANTSTPTNISSARDRFFFHFKMTSRAVTARPPLLHTGFLKTLRPDAECMSNVRTDNLPFSYSCTLASESAILLFHQSDPERALLWAFPNHAASQTPCSHKLA